MKEGRHPCDLANGVLSGEEKPVCVNCQRQGETCDYSVRLSWGGRTKRASTDSPCSGPSGYTGTIIEFADATPTSAVGTNRKRNLANRAPTDGFPTGEQGSSASASASTTAPRIVDTSKPHWSSEETQPSPQIESRGVATWAEHSPLPNSPPPGSSAQYALNHAFSGPYSPVADQGVGLRSLSAFAIHSNPVSQPLSFVRNSMDDRSRLSDSPPFSIEHGTQLPPPDELVLGVRVNGGLPQDCHPGSMPRTSGIGALPLGSHGLESNTASSSGPDAAMRPLLLRRSESQHSFRHSDDNIENEDAANDYSLAQSKWQAYLTSVTDNYGLDRGRPDRDLALNNDHDAIDITAALDMIHSRRRSEESALSPVSRPALDTRKPDYSGYYTNAVPINIPRYLAPLPPALLENPINLMYFHHFLNHTSRMLVPHDCDSNPFMSVLPAMAIGDSNLLNLLLAYSASHRARYLGHPEPANRIAHFVSDVFPALRVALESPHQEITDSHLATAILLLSLKIVSPGTFEVPVTWQSHLKLARDLFLARSESIARPGNKIGAFMARWLGYIDTMGALSCRDAGPPLMLYHSVLTACCGSEYHDEFGVDCFSGFTPRTGHFLIRLARLVQQCDNQRFDDMGNFCTVWHPSADVVMEAQAILGDIDDLSERAHANLEHHQGESDDMMAIEEAYRCAGLLHLHRRVLGSSPDSFPVKEALRKLIGALERMRLGASAEVCALFPLFTAGCESRDPSQRAKLLGRFFVLEESGLKQVCASFLFLLGLMWLSVSLSVTHIFRFKMLVS